MDTFALDSLNSSDSSSSMKLYRVKVLHIFLTKERFRAKTIQKLTTSTETVASLFSMLGWTSEGNTEIRLFAAKVTAEFAGSLRVVPIPGAMELIASLLDNTGDQPREHVLVTDGQEARQDSPIQKVAMAEHDSPILKYLKQMAIYLTPVDEPSDSDSDEQNSRIVRCWKRVTKCWSIPEEPFTDQDSLPVQGLILLERLASFDPENCMKISRYAGLISKIIDFTSHRNSMASTDEIMLAALSLRVLARLANAKGKLGVTLRHQILEHPFLLTKLAVILDYSGISSHELMELVAEILKNLSLFN